MVAPSFVSSSLAGMSFDNGDFWRQASGGGWATAAAVLAIILTQLVRVFIKRRSMSVNPANFGSIEVPASLPLRTRISGIISDSDLKDLITKLHGKSNENEKWEEVIARKNDSVSYNAKCCKSKEGPIKYLSLAIFDKCSTEQLRNFYMDSHFRKKWDKTLVEFEQLEVDEAGGTEIGRVVKKFPLLTPREYVLAWKVFEGNDKTFYCITKDCEHPLAPRQKKFVRVGLYRSGWRIRKVPGANTCEVAMFHQEEAGMNAEMAKLAFSKGTWSYVCKMSKALQEYSTCGPVHSPSVATMNMLIQKIRSPLSNFHIPDFIDNEAETTGSELSEISSDGPFSDPVFRDEASKSVKLKSYSKWIGNGLLLIGGIACLSRSRSTLGTQIALACIVKKLFKHGSKLEQAADGLQ